MIKDLLKLLMDFVLSVLRKSKNVRKLKLIRKKFFEKSTLGELFIDDKFECYTLEDKVRPPGEKVPGETAIPAGIYKVVIDYSDRFHRLMPHLLDVPMFTGIRIHSGNTNQDTEGCILVGTTIVNGDFVGNSRIAYDQLFTKLKVASDLGEGIEITII